MRKWKDLLLFVALVILWDVSLHLVQLFGVEEYHPFYPYFNTWVIYDIFWVSILSLVFILTILVLWKAR